jgi:DNA end-binding protein Ku
MKLESEMVDLAKELIERKSAKFDPAAFTDRYATALRELVEEKRKGRNVVEIESDGPQQRSGQVVDLMEALKKSLKNGKGSRLQRSSSRKGSRATQRKAS